MPLPPHAAACRATEDVRWDKMDMSYLQRDNYARMFAAELAGATPLESVGALGAAQCCLFLLAAPAAACLCSWPAAALAAVALSVHVRGTPGAVEQAHPDTLLTHFIYWPPHADEVPKVAPGRDYVLRYTSQQHYEKITGRLRMLREWRVSMQGSMGGSGSAAAS